MINQDLGEVRKKKTYIKPDLDSASVYEASGTTCCKTSAVCTSTTKGQVHKSGATSTTS